MACARNSGFLKNPDIMIKLQEDYVAAGTDILYAPTFTANRIKLEEYGLADRLEEMNRELIALSQKAAQGKALVASGYDDDRTTVISDRRPDV